MTPTTRDDVLRWLRETGTEEAREGMARYGIPNEGAFGVPVGEMKRFAKRLGTNHVLARELWETGRYEARTIAVFIADPARLTGDEMDRWAHDFDSWAICDSASFHLFDRSELAWSKVAEWAVAEAEYVKRAAFAVLWGLSVHDKEAPDASFLDGLRHVERGAHDDRHYVKKAVNMALRAIGKRNFVLNSAAIETARRLTEEDDAAPRWIGSHALRELESSRVRKQVSRRKTRS